MGTSSQFTKDSSKLVPIPGSVLEWKKCGDIGAVYKRLVKVGTHSGVCFRVEEMWGHRGSVQEARQGSYPFRGLF